MDRVVVLGAGFGGLELATMLSEALGDAVDVTLDRPVRRLRLRLLEARRDVREDDARRRRPAVRVARQAGRPAVAGDDHRDRPGGAAGDDRRRHPRGRPSRRRARRRLRLRRDARARRSRKRVLLGGRRAAARRAAARRSPPGGPSSASAALLSSARPRRASALCCCTTTCRREAFATPARSRS